MKQDDPINTQSYLERIRAEYGDALEEHLLDKTDDQNQFERAADNFGMAIHNMVALSGQRGFSANDPLSLQLTPDDLYKMIRDSLIQNFRAFYNSGRRDGYDQALNKERMYRAMTDNE